MSFNDIGKLMHLPLSDIQPGEPSILPDFVITAAADALVKTGGRNWMPLIVKQTGKYEYQVVSNSFIYAVAEQANLERVWAVVIDPDPEIIKLTKILSEEVLPKVNLSTASRDTIMAALKYLIEKPGSPLKMVNLLVAVDKLDRADRSTWKDFEPVSKLKCGITTAKVTALEEVFYLAPPALPEPPPPAPQPVSIKKALRDEIFTRLKYLSEYKVGGFDRIDPDQAADTIFTTSKSKWKSLSPVADLDCGIDKAKIKTLKTVFSL